MLSFYQAHFDREPSPPARHTFHLLTEGCQSQLVKLYAGSPLPSGLGKHRAQELLLIEHKLVAEARKSVK